MTKASENSLAHQNVQHPTPSSRPNGIPNERGVPRQNLKVKRKMEDPDTMEKSAVKSQDWEAEQGGQATKTTLEQENFMTDFTGECLPAGQDEEAAGKIIVAGEAEAAPTQSKAGEAGWEGELNWRNWAGRRAGRARQGQQERRVRLEEWPKVNERSQETNNPDWKK